ncbi:hypothetical protein KIL84_000158 [Mauremys mutica]|uniref:Uncharacterized protein n=1 Tax=Mauremys mutica TaxID=74926 RepID=A0A9D4AWC9_9SAUR|nr:hypothetical protein KIL84_000158 [Mauremys mutica]
MSTLHPPPQDRPWALSSSLALPALGTELGLHTATASWWPLWEPHQGGTEKKELLKAEKCAQQYKFLGIQGRRGGRFLPLPPKPTCLAWASRRFLPRQRCSWGSFCQDGTCLDFDLVRFC